MSWLFVSPSLLAGIGQVTKTYADFVGGEYVEIGQEPREKRYSNGFAFVLPTESHMKLIERYMALCKRMIYMTVCETEPVNPVYGLLERYGTVYCPSEFSRSTLEKQFPKTTWKLLRHYSPLKIERPVPNTSPYVFYTIGNIADPRKNIRSLVEAFLRCNFGTEAHLVLKATCIERVEWKIPGVTVINGLLSNDDLEKIHDLGHCYVNCSHSEGVGMGAVEAALRFKPVIMTDYGGLKEYVKTPWVVPCTKGPIGFDDFLFTKNLEWGHPSLSDLQRCLRECFEARVVSWDHEWTRQLMKDFRFSF